MIIKTNNHTFLLILIKLQTKSAISTSQRINTLVFKQLKAGRFNEKPLNLPAYLPGHLSACNINITTCRHCAAKSYCVFP